MKDSLQSASFTILYFATSEKNLNLTNVRLVAQADDECYKHIRHNRRFSLVNNIFHKRGEKHVFFNVLKSEKVRISSLRYKKILKN